MSKINYAMRPDRLMRVFKKSLNSEPVQEASSFDLLQVGQKLMAAFPDYINDVQLGTDQYTGNPRVDLSQDYNATDTYLILVNNQIEIRKLTGTSAEMSIGFFDQYDINGMIKALTKFIGEY